MAEPTVKAGTKRPHSGSITDPSPTKKQRVWHRIHKKQNKPSHVEPAPQDAEFVGGQLLRSIGAALTMAGFDSVKPSALEMFRAHVEEYMLELASYARTSMQGQRRTRPTAPDFATALSLMPNAQTASHLLPHLDLPIPESLSYPSIAEPDPAPAPMPDFATLLEPLVAKHNPRYVPSHFPQLPPEHAWKETPVYPSREKDSRKMREKATEEGMLAEQALRKLAAAAKVGAAKAETRKRTGAALAGVGKVRGGRVRPAVDDLFGDVLRDVGAPDRNEDSGFGMDGVADAKEGAGGLDTTEDVAVNYDMGNWRRGPSRLGLQR